MGALLPRESRTLGRTLVRSSLGRKERADKAEALARELVEALKHIERLAELARRGPVTQAQL